MDDAVSQGRSHRLADVVIDPDFRAQIPPIEREARDLLEASILSEGCRDPLVVWAETNTLLDGHNRYDICSRHGVPFQTRGISFSTREAAADWIDANQLGRRNLTPEALSLLRGRRYNRVKKAQGGTGANQHKQTAQSEPSATAATLAQQHGVSPATIKRDGAFAKAVEKLKPVIPDVEQRVLAGQAPSRDAIVKAAKHPESAKIEFHRSVHASSESPEHYTPIHIVAAADRCLGGIDLDPCSNSRTDPAVPAHLHYTKAEDGLSQPWVGSVYMNPPYGSEIPLWAKKLKTEYEDGKVVHAIALVPGRTDTEWFDMFSGYTMCFLRGRLTFGGNTAPAPFPSVVVYLGRDVPRFVEVFRGLGTIRVPYEEGMWTAMSCPHGESLDGECKTCDDKEQKWLKKRGAA